MANEKHLKLLLEEGVDAWNKWREANPKTIPDLSGAELSEANLSRANLSEAKLLGANLTEANLAAAYLREASLSEANLSRAKLVGANLTGAELWDANLSEANLTQANLSKAYLTEANLSGAELWRTKLVGAKLVGANLTRAELWRVNLSEANLSKAKLVGAKLTGVDLTGAKLWRANLSEAKLLGPDLTGAELSEANLSRADLSEAKLLGANLRKAQLDETDMCGGRGIEFDGNDLRRTKLNWQSRGPWLTLHRKYTPAKFFFHFVFLIAFILPYAARAFVWIELHKTQEIGISRPAGVEDSPGGDIEVAVTYYPDPNVSVSVGAETNTRPLKVRLTDLPESTRGEFRKWSLWQVLIGLDKPGWYAVTAFLLIIYNILRLLITTRVSVLNDEQNRTGRAPDRMSYIWMVWPHRLMTVLYLVALGSFLYYLRDWMTAPVYLPAY